MPASISDLDSEFVISFSCKCGDAVGWGNVLQGWRPYALAAINSTGDIPDTQDPRIKSEPVTFRPVAHFLNRLRHRTCRRRWFQIRSPDQLLLPILRLTTMYRSTGTQPSKPEKFKWRFGWVSLQHTRNIQIRRDESIAVRSHKNVQTAYETYGSDSLFAEHRQNFGYCAVQNRWGEMLHLSSDMFSIWKKRNLLLCRRKSGLLDADVSKLFKRREHE
jgi:hypothetical protein